MHSRIQKHCRKKDVFSQDQWRELISESKTKNKYLVNEIDQDQIYNFEDLSKLFQWKNVRISNVKEISVSPSKLIVKYNLDDSAGERINIFKKNITKAIVRRHALPIAYESRLPLSQKKTTTLRIW